MEWRKNIAARNQLADAGELWQTVFNNLVKQACRKP
jgi:hypothetical protein